MSVTGNNLVRAVSTLGLSDLETRVIKATYADDDPPKQKHVDALLSYTHEYNIVPLLEKQILEGNWRYVFKTLVVIHRCTQEGDARFLKNLLRRRQILDLSSWNDFHSTSARQHIKYIRLYGATLQAKIQAYSLLGLCVERETPVDAKRLIVKLSADDICIKWLPVFIVQFDTILQCYPTTQSDISHPVTASSMSLLIKDAFRMYSVITVTFLQILEIFETLNVEQLNSTSTSLIKFQAQNERFKEWSEKLTRLGMIQSKVLPKFDAIPSTFAELVEERIRKLTGKSGDGGKSGKDKDKKQEKEKKKKKSKKHESSDDEEDESDTDTSPKQRTTQRDRNARRNTRDSSSRDEDAEEEEESDSENVRPVNGKRDGRDKRGKSVDKGKAAAAQHNVEAQLSAATAAAQDDDAEEDLDSEEERARRKAKRKAKKKAEKQRLKQQQQEQDLLNGNNNTAASGNPLDFMQNLDPIMGGLNLSGGSNAAQQKASNADIYTQLQQRHPQHASNAMIPYGQPQPQQVPYQQRYAPYAAQQGTYNPYQQAAIGNPSATYSPAGVPPPAYGFNANSQPAYGLPPAQHPSYQPQPQQPQLPPASSAAASSAVPSVNKPTPGNPLEIQQYYDSKNTSPQPPAAAAQQPPYDLLSAPQPNQAAVDGLFNAAAAAAKPPQAAQPQPQAAAAYGKSSKAKQAADEMFADLL